MQSTFLVRTFATVTAILAAVILYGSLYPFAFHVPENGLGPIQALLEGWNRKPGRGDFLSNILLYMPLGFFAMSALGSRISAGARMCLAVLFGASLSVCIETLQYFDAGRDPEASDIYSNTIGTALGACLTFFLTNAAAARFFGQRVTHRIPLLLLGAWAGYKLYPYVPVIDLHKYWNALKPLLLYPTASRYEVFQHAASWVLAALLISRATDGRKEVSWFAAFAACVMFAKIFIIDAAPSLDDILGALFAICWIAATKPRERLRIASALALLAASVLAERLEPFVFVSAAGPFGWIPFSGFMYGSINVNVLSFLQKFFLYGGLIWLLQQCGLGLVKATILVAAGLLLTSVLEVHLPGRSAEITDAMMAVIIGITFAMVGKSSAPAPFHQI